MAKAKKIKGLDCETIAARGIALVLRSKLNDMCAQRDAAFDWSDIEGVHTMRVTSRRLRSALRDFAPYLSKQISPKPLQAVARSLGAVRDEDVAIVMMEKLAAEAGEEFRPGIEQLTEERRERRLKARAALKKGIAKDVLKELQKKFDAQLERATEESGSKKSRRANKAAETLRFHHVGREIIMARFLELQDLSQSLYQPFVPEPLHRMRIAAKRLRYSIELYTQCWGEQLTPYAKAVAELQESLGELHDCDVWIDELGARLVKLHQQSLERQEESSPTTDAHSHESRAALWLLQYFVKERTRHYRDALMIWDKWETTDFPARLSEALDEDGTTLESQSPAAHAAHAL